MSNKLVFLPVAILLASCSTDISSRPPFNASVGRPLVTKRAAFLYRNAKWESPEEWRKTLNLTDYTLVAPRDHRRKEAEVSIPPGQNLTVHHVTRRVGDGFVTYEAYGEVFVPSQGHSVPFRFNWGYYDKIVRAPWEASEVPMTRLLR